MAKTSAELKAEAAALQEQMKVAGAAAAELRQQARALERKELRERQEWERAEHASQMWREVGRPIAGLTEAQHGSVYALAYDLRHEDGYYEVGMLYGDLATLAVKILQGR